MDETKRIQAADFLSIALEQMESGNHEVAKEFVEDTYAILQQE